MNFDVAHLLDDSKEIWTEIKQMKTQFNELSEIKRKLAILNRLPSDTDFNQLKHRVEMCENINNNYKRRMDDLDKRLKGMEAKGAGGQQVASVERMNTENSQDENSVRALIDKLEKQLKKFKDD